MSGAAGDPMAMALRVGSFDPVAYAEAFRLDPAHDLRWMREDKVLAYLATPYSKRATLPGGGYSSCLGGQAAFEAAVWTAAFARHGVTAISPIVLSHEACVASSSALDPLDAAFWSRWCWPLLAASDVLIVPDILGWRESAGVRHEIRMAAERGTTVSFAERMP